MSNRVEIRYEAPGWRIYWPGTDEAAIGGRFATLEEAGAAARRVLGLEPADITPIDAPRRAAQS